MIFGSEVNYFDVMTVAKKHYAKLLEPICKQWELTRNELDILLFLFNNPEYDRAADIVSRRGITKSHVSMSVASLEEKGLLIRRFDENDRRTAHLELQDSGSAIAAQAREKQMQFFTLLYNGISQEEFDLWKKFQTQVYKNIENFEITP